MPNKLRELMLLRHAKSEWKPEGMDDLDRPLTDKGKKNAAKMGKWLLQQSLMPDLILVSPAQRAQQTLRRICNECPANTVTVQELYRADLPTLMKVLADTPEAQRVMVIGHNPGLERMLTFLTDPEDQSCEKDDSVKLFPTTALAHFILPQDWRQLEEGDGKLVQFVRPKDITLQSD